MRSSILSCLECRRYALTSLLSVLLSLVFLSGCSRGRYRNKADKEAYGLIEEGSINRPWAPEGDFSIQPDPRSRVYDSGDPDDPDLPDPGPDLYAYKLPDLGAEGLVSRESSIVSPSATPRTDASEPTNGAGALPAQSRIGGLAIQPIPKSYWGNLPAGCISRMVEFDSVIEEYRKRHGVAPSAELRDQADRLSLKWIIQVALIESREYQSEKEGLYRAALSLSRERFDYRPRLAPNGLGSDAALTQTRSGGTTEEALGISSAVQANQMLSTGGALMARLANDVVVSFSGPEGFATEVGSDFLFSLNQSLLQRDVRLNPLIQAERDLVYAARSYARFRKQFFEGLASQYYSLLQTYRSIEIESQNYFSLIRTFEQARAEVRSGVKNAPNQVAVDQFEQSMLSGRSSLISTWNGLERDLDDLKLSLGVPTETPFNIDLNELKQLTLLDEIEVAGERVRRWRSRVEDRSVIPNPNRNEILNANIFLIQRLLEWFALRGGAAIHSEDIERFQLQLLRFQVESAEITVELANRDLIDGETTATRNPIIMQFHGTSALVQSMLSQERYLIQLALKSDLDKEAILSNQKGAEIVRGEMVVLFEELDLVLEDPRREKLEALLIKVVAIKERMDEILTNLNSLVGVSRAADSEEALLESTLSDTKILLDQSAQVLRDANSGLLPINIKMDDAMATALVQRMDLMNERGRLADDWRLIKITADDLKSVLNLDLSQSVGTRNNKAFEFSGDESRTRLGLSFDLPVNRIEQRNNYRNALIRFQAQRRSLMGFEDQIKFDIRNRLRDMAQTRLQYPISVTRAALAAEQVTSIRLQLALGVPGVRGTDLLDALQDLREALIDVANFRIRYIVADAQFAVDLESMELDEFGFWPHINDSDFQHVRNLIYPEGAGPTYGDIPPFLKVSKQLKRLVDSPLPGSSEAESTEHE
ncbi:TolC family protein [Verrucomicrobia bacterium]|nr:TolC family protein [Verrucomicrobiota bacterium]MDB4798643.1 TolC family protein [Verrucomicrobiota bacterium]